MTIFLICPASSPFDCPSPSNYHYTEPFPTPPIILTLPFIRYSRVHNETSRAKLINRVHFLLGLGQHSTMLIPFKLRWNITFRLFDVLWSFNKFSAIWNPNLSIWLMIAVSLLIFNFSYKFKASYCMSKYYVNPKIHEILCSTNCA